MRAQLAEATSLEPLEYRQRFGSLGQLKTEFPVVALEIAVALV